MGTAHPEAACRLACAAAETLPAAVRRWRQLGVPLLLELLGGVRASIEGAGAVSGAGGGRAGRTLAQQLFAQAQAFLQVANILNEEYPEVSDGEIARCCSFVVLFCLASVFSPPGTCSLVAGC